MGAWGYEAFGNDTACDFMYEVEAPMKKAMEKDPWSYDEMRAIAELAITLDPIMYGRFDQDITVELLARLEIIAADKKWINGWNKPGQIKKELGRQIKLLKKIVKTYK